MPHLLDSIDGDAIRHRCGADPRRRGAGASAGSRRLVAREEPLEIQVRGVPLAVVMRTPGHDEELVRGFLVTERVVRARRRRSRPCATAASSSDPAAEDNVIAVSLRDDVALDLEALRRNLFTSASCGICGKATHRAGAGGGAAARRPDPRRAATRARRDGAARRRPAGRSPRTGGLHAAGLFTADGALLVVREDVGRHNAVDKVIGWALARDRAAARRPRAAVSGRISFEIAQKALAARIPVVAAVSAPSSLAVDLAERAGMTLIGFARGERFNVYGRQRSLR